MSISSSLSNNIGEDKDDPVGVGVMMGAKQPE